MSQDADALKNLLAAPFLEGLSPQVIEKVIQFRTRLEEANRLQNLTRLITPVDFYEGHFLDVWHFLKSGFLNQIRTVLDLGSGCGVPGLLAALLKAPQGPHWVLCEAEKHKAAYLSKEVSFFQLQAFVQILPWRYELAVQQKNPLVQVDSLCWRALGPLTRVSHWIFHPRSTWNNCFLFKGPAWEEEWNHFRMQQPRLATQMRIQNIHEYSIGEKKRVLVWLIR